jgi:hypothetical protein
MNAQEWEKKIEEATEEALFSFWAKIVEIFPEATGGDLMPDQVFTMDSVMEDTLRSWLTWNHPTYESEAGR